MEEYINLLTGEILCASSRIHAYFRYKACTPRKWVKWFKIVTINKYYKNADKYGF